MLQIELELPKTASQIQTGKYPRVCSPDLLNALINRADTVSVRHRLIIQRTVVQNDAHAAPMRFGHTEDWRIKLGIGFFDEAAT